MRTKKNIYDDGKLTYLGSEILRAERKKIFVNELGSLERKVFQKLLPVKSILKKIGQHNFGEFLKIFGQHIWVLVRNFVNIFGV